MKQLLIAVVVLFCASASSQTINPNQIRPSSTNGQALVTQGGKTQWGDVSGTPSGGKYAIQYDNDGLLGGASFTGLVKNNGSTQPPSAATFSDIVPLWNSGTCAGYLKSDGTCSDVATNPAMGAAGTVQVSNGSGQNAAGTAANVAASMSSLFLSPNYLFGDSTTAGVGCDIYPNCQAGLLTNAHAGPTFNQGFGGDMASDAVIHIAQTLNPGANTTTPGYTGVINIGVNDASGCGGTNVACQQNYSAEQNAAVALFEMTGTSYQTLAPSCTLTGSWTSDTTKFAGGIYVGKVSTTNGDSFSCAITTTGNGVGLEYVTSNGGGGTASCALDGGTAQTITFAPYINTGKTTYTIFRSSEFAASAGSHTLACTVTSATGSGNPVEFIAVDSIPVGQTANLNHLTMTNVVSNGGTNDAASLDISNLVQPIVNAYQAEGANVVFADIRTPTNNPNDFAANVPGCPTNAANSSGGLHYNDCGHRAVYNAIQAASPNVYQTNIGAKSLGVSPGPFQGFGNVISSMVGGSGQSTGNAGFVASITGIMPGGWCTYANNCLMLVNTGSFIIPGYAANTYTQMLTAQGGPVCIGWTPSTMTTPTQLFPARDCWISNGDYYQFFPNGGSPIATAHHVGFLSRDNQVAASGSSVPSRTADISFIGPLTQAILINLPVCKSNVSNAENYELTYYRHGTDGYAVTLSSNAAAGDNINGGSVGNTFIWNATEGNQLTLQCSATQIGGSSWTISTQGISPTPTLNSYSGAGSATFALGAAAQVGTGATAPVCGAGYSCNSIDGLIQFTTGTGTLTAGTILTITPGLTRAVFPVCILTTSSATYIGANATATTTTVTVNAAAALAPSTPYNISYHCGGN